MKNIEKNLKNFMTILTIAITITNKRLITKHLQGKKNKQTNNNTYLLHSNYKKTTYIFF